MKPFLFALLLILFIGCSKPSPEVVKRDGEPDVILTDKGDPEMEEAINRARSTLSQFVDALSHPTSSRSGFALKASFPYDSITRGEEHIWLIDIALQGEQFSGTVNNEPLYTRAVKFGDSVTVTADRISDWKYVENSRLVGGYTIRMTRKRMTPEDRKRFDEAAGYTIDE